MEEEKKACEAEATEYTDLCTTIKDALGDKVEKVIVSNRLILLASSLLVNSAGHPTWYVIFISFTGTDEYLYLLQERIMKAQALRDSSIL